jgi:hypothetical protein
MIRERTEPKERRIYALSKRRGGGTGSYKRPEQGNVYTAKTLTGLVGDGE